MPPITLSQLEMNLSKKLILALDTSDQHEALSWVDQVISKIHKFKVGSQLFTACGPSIVSEIKKRGGDVFLDLKFHDIPNTVFGAVKSASSLGVFMLNVHISGGKEMLKQTLKARDQFDHQPLLIGVTVLTSLSSEDLKVLGYKDSIEKVSLSYSKMAYEAGLDGVVCSVHEVEKIKRTCGKKFITVTPGIRMESDLRQDQKRSATVEEALKVGTDYLILGRTLTEASNPLEKLSCII